MRKPSAPDPPVSPELRLIFWELTGRCNLVCAHCRAGGRAADAAAELSTRECRHVIEDIASFSSPLLIFTGGEPLLREDLFDVVRHARDAGLEAALATNGTLITLEVARRIAHAGLRRVSVSIDGASASVHDAMRRVPGAFENALRGVRLLRAEGIPVQFNTTVTKHNAGGLEAILELARREDVQAVHFFVLVPVGCGLDMTDAMLSAAEYEAALLWIARKRLEAKLELKATCAPAFARILARSRELPRREETPEAVSRVTRGCLAGRGVCFISRAGDVQPCGYLPIRVGNVRQTPLSAIWRESDDFLRLRDTGLLEGACGACAFAEVCGGCRARAFAATGNYLAAEPCCAYNASERTASASSTRPEENRRGRLRKRSVDR